VAVGSPAPAQGPLMAGNYSWNAMYNGDSNYAASPVSACEPFSISKGSTSVVTTLIGVTEGSAPFGSMVNDSAAVTPVPPIFTLTGTVTYSFFTNGACTGTPASTFTVAVGSNSPAVGPLSAGNYSFNAVYNGDSNYAASSVSGCEPFKVIASVTINTIIISPESLIGYAPASSQDSSYLTHQTGNAGGTVTYTLFMSSSPESTDGVCAGTPVAGPFTVSVTSGVPGNSPTVSGLAAGYYGWQASYSGDAFNNKAGPSNCEPFKVMNTPSISTEVETVTTTPVAWEDSAFLSGATSNAGGTVTYILFASSTPESTSGVCTGTIIANSNVTVTAGVVPDSAKVSGLAAGYYGWEAVYSGDALNTPATGPCEPFSVIVPVVITTTLVTPATGVENAPGSAQDSSALIGATSNAGGTVTYTLYMSSSPESTQGVCTGSPVAGPFTVSVTSGVPGNSPTVSGLAAGYYGWEATYSGDSLNNAATAPCEPFKVMATPVISTEVEVIASNPTSYTDAAFISGATSGFGGTVTYTLFMSSTPQPNTGSCIGTPVSGASSTVTITGGVVPDATAVSGLGTGYYGWQAVYNGDALDNIAVGPCEPFSVILPPTPSVSLTITCTSNSTGSCSGKDGQSSITWKITATNNGSVTENLSFTLSGPGAPSTYGPVVGLAPGSSVTFTVTASGLSPGSYTEMVTVVPSTSSTTGTVRIASATCTIKGSTPPPPPPPPHCKSGDRNCCNSWSNCCQNFNWGSGNWGSNWGKNCGGGSGCGGQGNYGCGNNNCGGNNNYGNGNYGNNCGGNGGNGNGGYGFGGSSGGSCGNSNGGH